MIQADLRHQIIASRLLVLQSKRRLLVSSERRLKASGQDRLRRQVERVRAETATAQYNYRESMLRWGDPGIQDYWPIAYFRLIETGNLLTRRLRLSIDQLPPSERYEVSTDVEMLEKMVLQWSQSMRTAMAASVA